MVFADRYGIDESQFSTRLLLRPDIGPLRPCLSYHTPDPLASGLQRYGCMRENDKHAR